MKTYKCLEMTFKIMMNAKLQRSVRILDRESYEIKMFLFEGIDRVQWVRIVPNALMENGCIGLVLSRHLPSTLRYCPSPMIVSYIKYWLSTPVHILFC